MKVHERLMRDSLRCLQEEHSDLEDVFLKYKPFDSVSEYLDNHRKEEEILRRYKLKNSNEAITRMVELSTAISYFQNRIYFDFKTRSKGGGGSN